MRPFLIVVEVTGRIAETLFKGSFGVLAHDEPGMVRISVVENYVAQMKGNHLGAQGQNWNDNDNEEYQNIEYDCHAECPIFSLCQAIGLVVMR